MLYPLLADAVVVLHLGFILFVVLGGLLALRRPRAAWLHIPAALWAVYITLTGTVCPLTPLENHFRRAAGESGYGGGFIDHYLLPVIYPCVFSSAVQWSLAGIVLTVNAAVYTLAWRKHR